MTDDAFIDVLRRQGDLIARSDDRGFAALARAYAEMADFPDAGDTARPLRERLFFHSVLPEILHRLDPVRTRTHHRPRRGEDPEFLPTEGARLAATLVDLPDAALADSARLYLPAAPDVDAMPFEIIVRRLLAPEAIRRIASRAAASGDTP